jgi:predicted transcriptional regulator
MNDTEDAAGLNFVELTADVVAAYVANNAVHKADLPALIASVHVSLVGLGRPATPAQSERPVPPVSIKKSIGDDYIISMEDGRRYKSLKRHLSGRGLTPEQYREKWGLPYDASVPNSRSRWVSAGSLAGLPLRKRGRRAAAGPLKAGRSRRPSAPPATSYTCWLTGRASPRKPERAQRNHRARPRALDAAGATHPRSEDRDSRGRRPARPVQW